MMQISELLKEYQLSDVKAVDENGDTLLHLVMKNEKFTSEETVELVQILLNEGVDPNAKNKNRETVLHLAIAKRSQDVIDCLLACKVEVGHLIAHTLIDDEKKRLEKLLVQKEQILDCEMQKFENESASFVEWIVSKGLDIDDVHDHYCDGPCALMLAIENDLQHIIPIFTKHTQVINFIKAEEDSISDSDYNHEEDLKGTVLHLFLGQIDNNRKYFFHEPKKTWYSNYTQRYAASIVKTMLDKGVSAEVANGFGNTALHEAILQKENINIIEMLIEHTKNLNHKNNEGKTPFYTVIYKWLWSKKQNDEYYMNISRALIAKGADANEPNKYGSSPLGNAVERRNTRVVEFLRDSGADFSLIPKGGASLMHLLVEESHCNINKEAEIKLFHLLVTNGCPVNAKEKQHSGKTPLHEAANSGNEEIVRKLIEHGADVNCKSNTDDTPLHYLCQYNQYINMAKLLLELGANVNANNSEGDTPLHLAAASSRSGKAADLLKFLLENGADMNQGFSVIHWALWKDHNEDCWGEDMTDIHDIPDLFDCIEEYASNEVKVLLRHWVKLDAAKLKYRVRGYIDEDLKNLVDLKKYKLYHQKCLKEVELLKSTFIDSRVSFYTYLHMDPTSRCIYINNEKLKNLVDSSKIKKQFPGYATLILSSYRESVTRKSLLQPVIDRWLEITKIILPDICIERIFSFLSNAYLFKFIEKS